MTRSPRSFVYPLDSAAGTASGGGKVLELAEVKSEDEPEGDFTADAPAAPPQKRKSWWSTVFFAALGALLSMAFALWLDDLVRRLFSLNTTLGFVAAAMVVLMLVAFLFLVGREIAGILWERKIADLRRRATEAAAVNNGREALRVVNELAALYAPDRSAEQKRLLQSLREDILDADDRLAVAEREFLAPLDGEAKSLIAASARRVSLLTALSPRAILDVLIVLFVIIRLLRRISALYGGRPGILGLLRLLRHAFAHLAVTAGIAVGDNIAHGVLGAGLAARLSSRLGEGVLNGFMTIRFGIAAVDICRPLPFLRSGAPRFSDIAAGLLSTSPPSDEKTE
ncbi:MAG: TIGR01620 family protein [Methylobacteriaceae bacterium]|jgi:putative membrane protein|nr:TIGR01620 family protein [Methylobacteriaceae bacterium]